MRKLDNKGMTLVELIIGICLLAIAGVMLAQSFAATSRIVMRASLYKNVSMTTAASIELNEVQTPINTDYEVTMAQKTPSGGSLTIRFTRPGEAAQTFTMGGQYAIGTANATTTNANLTYKEFLPSNFSYELPAEPLGE